MRGKNTLTAWIMAGIGAVFVLWLAVLIAPYAEGGLPGILLNMNEITAHPFRLELCADTGKAVSFYCPRAGVEGELVFVLNAKT